MTEQIKVRVSDQVPRDEVWFGVRLPWEVYLTPTGIAVMEHFRVLGKIVSSSPITVGETK